jgi:hypothetical protein
MHAGAPHFFAGMSLSAAILFDRALKQTRRAALREQGLVPRPLPQIRFVRWMRAPRETFGAWSLMLLEGVRTLDEAVDEVRDERRERETKKRREKEQRRLERSRNRALRRQHRMFGRGRAPRVEVAVGSGAAAVGTAEAAAREPGQLPAARQAPGLSTAATGAAAPADAKTRASVSGSGRAPLDTLEAKLAQIEKQFD